MRYQNEQQAPVLNDLVFSSDGIDMRASSVIQFARLENIDKPMDRIEINYRALLAVAVVLNSQRDMHSLWGAITAEITKVIPWARASVTLYDPETDGFRFHVFTTTLSQVVLQRDAVIPHVGSGMGWTYDHKTVHIRADLTREQVFLEDKWYVEEGLGRMINLPLLVRDNVSAFSILPV